MQRETEKPKRQDWLKTARGRLVEFGQGKNLACIIVELHCTFESLSSLQTTPVPETLTQGIHEGLCGPTGGCSRVSFPLGSPPSPITRGHLLPELLRRRQSWNPNLCKRQNFTCPASYLCDYVCIYQASVLVLVWEYKLHAQSIHRPSCPAHLSWGRTTAEHVPWGLTTLVWIRDLMCPWQGGWLLSAWAPSSAKQGNRVTASQDNNVD